MLLKKSIDKTNFFFSRSLQSLKTFIFGGYKRLPRAPSFNPFSCSSSRRNLKDHQFDHYPDFLEELESGQDNAKEVMEKNIISMKEPAKEGNESPVKIKQEEIRGGKAEKKIGNSNAVSKRGKSCLKSENGGSYRLAQKMKEMEMMDVGNVDHVLDVEEVLHYYSRLKSPVYLDIVDKFFMDMNSEILHPQPSVSRNNSKRRLRPLKLYKP